MLSEHLLIEVPEYCEGISAGFSQLVARVLGTPRSATLLCTPGTTPDELLEALVPDATIANSPAFPSARFFAC